MQKILLASLVSAAFAMPAVAAEQADVVIIGSGGAGLSAAVTAHDLGKKVIVLEKMAMVGGNTNRAAGGLNAAETKPQAKLGIKDSIESHFNDTIKGGHYLNNPDLDHKLTDNAKYSVDFINDLGGDLNDVGMMAGASQKRAHRPTGGGFVGAEVVRTLYKASKDRNIDIRTMADAQKLIVKDGKVVGVQFKQGKKPAQIVHAKAVVIASGGFSANPEMVDKYIGGWATRMVLRGSKSTTGENISLTLPLYAKCVNMDQFHAGPIIGATHVNPADVLNSGYGIQVNTSGDRYMDENNTYVIKARTTAQKTLDNTGWVIVDSTCPVLDKVIPKFDMLNSPYGKANTIEEVAKQAGLPPAKIVALVKEYNDAVKNGTLGKMNPPNTYKKPHLIEKAPFYAVPLQGGMTATFGGPLINTKAEVQNLDGKTIPGLYAVGNSSGGIFFHNYAGGAQLGAATVFGRIAGKEMAQRAAAAK